MTELRHFADGGYPGDKRLGIPEFEDDLPFDHAYAIRLQTDKENPEVSDLDKIAEYIALATTTRCSDFFETSRSLDKDNEEFGFRSFGVSICGPGLQVQNQEAVNRLSKCLIEKWIDLPVADKNQVDQFIDACIADFNIKLEDATTASIEILMELDEWSPAQESIQRALNMVSPNCPLNFAELSQYFDSILGSPYWRKETNNMQPPLCEAAELEISTDSQIIGDQLSSRILSLLNSNKVSFHWVLDVITTCYQSIAVEHESVMTGLHNFGSQMCAIKEELAEIQKTSKGQKRSNLELALVKKYEVTRTQEFALRVCSDRYRFLKSCLSSTEEIVKKFRLQLKAIGDSFKVAPEQKRSARYSPTIKQMLVESVDENRQQLIVDVEQLVIDTIKQQGEFLDVVSDATNWQQMLPEIIQKAAQSVLSNAFKKISIDSVIAKNNIQPAALKSWLNEQLNEATPFVTDCGGSATLLLGQPRLASNSILPKIIADCFDVSLKEISGTTGDFIMCFEAERIMLANLAFSILKDAPEATEIARRVPSRDDVDWTTLDDLM